MRNRSPPALQVSLQRLNLDADSCSASGRGLRISKTRGERQGPEIACSGLRSLGGGSTAQGGHFKLPDSRPKEKGRRTRDVDSRRQHRVDAAGDGEAARVWRRGARFECERVQKAGRSRIEAKRRATVRAPRGTHPLTTTRRRRRAVRTRTSFGAASAAGRGRAARRASPGASGCGGRRGIG